MEPILDSRERVISGVFVYTGIIPNTMSKESFRKEYEHEYPKNGYYMTLSNFYSDKKLREGLYGLNVRNARRTNAAYRGMQFLLNGKTGDIYWFYYLPFARLSKFKYIKPCMDYEILENVILRKGFYMRWSNKYFSESGEDRNVILFYNPLRNLVLKVDTNFLMSNRLKLFSPVGEQSPDFIFKKKSMQKYQWRKISVKKAVKPLDDKMYDLTDSSLSLMVSSLNKELDFVY